MRNKPSHIINFIILAVLFLSVLNSYVFALGSFHSREELKKDFEEAMVLFDSARYEEAVVAFEKIMDIEKAQNESYFTPFVEIYIEKSRAKIRKKKEEFKILLEGAKKIEAKANDEVFEPENIPTQRTKEQAIEEALKSLKKEKVFSKEPDIEIVKGRKNHDVESTAQEEEMMLEEESAGDIDVFVNGDKIAMRRPVLVIESKVWMPLKDISQKLEALLIDMGANRFNVIRGDGVPLEIEIGKRELLVNKQVAGMLEDPPQIIDKAVMVSLASMNKILDFTSKWDEDSKAVRVETKYSASKFSSFSVPKPKVAKPKVVSKLPVSALIAEPLPEKVKPHVQLNANVSSSFEYFRTGRSIEDLSLTVNGKAHDYGVSSLYLWRKDEHDSFQLLGGSIDISKDSFNMRIWDNNLNLDSLRVQSEHYKGIKVADSWDSLQLTGIAGTTETSVSGTDSSVKYFGNIYGIREKYNFNDAIELGGTILRTENEPEFSYQKGLTSFPSENNVVLTDVNFKLPYDILLSSKYAASYYIPDNKVKSHISDKDIAAGLSINKKKWNLKYDYELIGDKFVSVGNPANYQDYEGEKTSYNYQIFDSLSIGAGFEEYHNNVDNDQALPTTDHQVISTRTSLMLPYSNSLNFGWYRDKTQTHKLGTGDINNAYRIDLSSPLRAGSLLLTYERFQTDFLDATPSRDINTFGINVFKFFQNKSYLSLHQDMKETRDQSVTGREKKYNTELSYYYYITQKLKGYIIPEFQITKGPTLPDNRNLGFLKTGGEYQVDSNTNVTLEYRIRSYDLKTGGSPPDWSILCRLVRNFGISSEPTWGKIRGMVFEDSNDNEKPDDNELGVADAVVYLDKDRDAVTDASGYFYFDKVVPDNHKLSLDTNNLPINLVSKSVPEKIIITETKATSNVNFPLMTLGTIQGRVFIDANNNGSYDESEDAISGIIVSLSPKDMKTKTDRNGIYIFEYLYAGTYIVNLDTSAIPLGYQLISPERWSFDLPIGGKIINSNFLLKPKPVLFETFPSKKKE
ncbi:MAG: hypothetical protein AUJ70_00350 [Candidatus Omnitrophica bacterium CG1_02_40_15]|nr:MAG: hypothetical protein AUJ70_00350 [Candidatus Omnitrophica bacterium CG1_02_40_15]